ncbi:hypothetical protein NIES2100_34940 [Calothrix sp. NIES-2100]|uniref:hypothetical protein n=1 Tax=Calothrix sp. NIES-2100 TaxID=1954172 RepID=UPI000B61E605|nr:hypothetical protein NIES2100_34940 [Calothrix sp. NIES-2100]
MSGSFAPSIPGSHPGFVAGRYYINHYGGAPTTGTINTGSVYYVFYYIPVTASFDRLCVNVTTAASAGNTGRLAIYNLSGNTPTSLIVDAGDVAIDSTGSKEATISVTLSPGWYALAFMQSGGSAVFNASGTSASVAGYVFGTTSVSTSFNTCLRATLSYGAYPSTASTSSIAVATTAPTIWLRAS